MKFIHVSDLHLGRKISGFSMCELQSEILDYILKYIDENNIDSVLISGDVYDKPVPAVEAVNLFDNFLTSLSQKNLHTFIISGNHDSPERLQFASHILEKNNIHIAGTLNNSMPKFTLNDEYGNINIFLLPFAKLSAISALYPDFKFNSLSDALEKIICDNPIDTDERNILLYHGFVLGNNCMPETSESENQLGGIQIVDADVFSDFDYTALGHIHKPQYAGKNIRYSGSILKYSFSEVNREKSFTVINMKEKNNISIEECPLVPSKDMRIIKGCFSDIISNFEKSGDFIRVELLDNEKIPLAMEQLRDNLFPNIMELVYVKELERISAVSTEIFTAENRSMIELVKEFFHSVYDEQLNDEKNKILTEICTEVLNETY